MAGDGAGRLLGQYAARAEGGRGDIPGVLRIGGRAVSAGESAHRARIYRCPSEGRQEARDDTSATSRRSRAYIRPRIYTIPAPAKPCDWD